MTIPVDKGDPDTGVMCSTVSRSLSQVGVIVLRPVAVVVEGVELTEDSNDWAVGGGCGSVPSKVQLQEETHAGYNDWLAQVVVIASTIDHLARVQAVG